MGHRTAYQCIRLVLFSSRNTKSPQLIVLLSHYFSKLSPLHVVQLQSVSQSVRWAFFPRLTDVYAACYQTSWYKSPPPTSLHLWSPIFCISAADDNRLVINSTTDLEIFSYDTPRHVHVSWVFLTSNTDPEIRNLTRVQ